MSLEQHIQELNTNIVALIGALQEIGKGPSPAEVAEAILDTPISLGKPTTEIGSAPAPKPTPKVEPSPAVVTFDEMKKTVLKLATRDRKMAVDLLKNYGATKVSDVAEKDFADLVAVAKKMLEG